MTIVKIGVPRELTVKESRVACTPGGARMLVQAGHVVLVENNAGRGSECSKAGARIVSTAEDAWAADMVIKVKEPIESEYRYFRPELLLFTYLHLATEKTLTEKPVETKTTGIAYETVRFGSRLPLLFRYNRCY